MNTKATAAPADEVLEAVANETRREVVRVLESNGGGPVDLGDLATEMAKGNNSFDAADFETVLYHNHCPILADAGLVEYDPGSGTVRHRGGEDVMALLALVEERFE
jgi:DNA-binding transcriptional ArsR family regulator